MRRILTGSLGVALGLGIAPASAHDPSWKAIDIGAPVAASRPAVALGAPVVTLGAPRSATHSRPTVVARAQVDDRTPMPAGSGAANPPAPLPAPTPISPAVGGPVMGVPVEGMPYQPGMPFGSNVVPPGGIDPGFAPLPGGVFVPESVPGGMLFFVNAEYLFWQIRDTQLPSLLTTSNAASFGVLGVGDTRVLVGNTSINDEGMSGGRLTVGGWFSRCQNWGWDTSYFFLTEQSTAVAFANPGTGVLARPFQLPDGRQTSELISFPNTFAGTFSATTRNSLWGADANLKRNLCLGCRSRLDFLTGFRYLRFDEELTINETFDALPAVMDPRFAGIRGTIVDNFEVNNEFYGGQFGLNSELRRGRWSLNLQTKVALGTTRQTVEIAGAQTVTQGGQTQIFPGLLTQPTNTGRFTRDAFSVVPEVGLNLGWQATPFVKLFVGYNFLYWSNVLRAGDQVDTVINTPAQPGANPVRPATFPIQQTAAAPFRPTVPFRETDFWAQGINVGLQLSW